MLCLKHTFLLILQNQCQNQNQEQILMPVHLDCWDSKRDIRHRKSTLRGTQETLAMAWETENQWWITAEVEFKLF